MKAENIKLDAKLMKKANSYLDWIMYVYLFNQGRTITLKGEQYKLSDIITLNVSNKKDLLKTLAKEEVVEQIDLKEKIGQILKNKSDEENKKSDQALKELLEWKYDYIVDTTLPTKSSVTKIKQEKIKLEEMLKGIESEEVEYKKSYTPKFMQEDKKISNAEKGTLVHFMYSKIR